MTLPASARAGVVLARWCSCGRPPIPRQDAVFGSFGELDGCRRLSRKGLAAGQAAGGEQHKQKLHAPTDSRAPAGARAFACTIHSIAHAPEFYPKWGLAMPDAATLSFYIFYILLQRRRSCTPRTEAAPFALFEG